MLGQSLVLVIFLFLVLISSTCLCSLFTVVAVSYFCSGVLSAVYVCFSWVFVLSAHVSIAQVVLADLVSEAYVGISTVLHGRS